MKAAVESLNTDMQALSSELYSRARGSGAQGGAGEEEGQGPGPKAQRPAEGGGEGGGKKDGDVIDADFEMMDDDKKQK